VGALGRSIGRVVALVPNLMDRGRVEGAVRSAGGSPEFVSTVAELTEAVTAGARVAVIDLAVPDVLPAVRTLDAATIGFAGHVDRDVLRRGREAGCDEVMPRSAISHRLPQVLETLAVRSGELPEPGPGAAPDQ
jgi:hypothetical protein